MILECPSCAARFKVADSAIPDAGRTVRCSKCAHQWHVDKAVVTAQIPVVSESFTRAKDTAMEEAVAAITAAKASAEAPQDEPANDLSPEALAEGEKFLSQLEAAINASEAVEERPQAKRTVSTKKRRVLDPKPFKLAVPAIAAIWLVMAFLTYFSNWLNAPVLGGIYRAFGVAPTDGLVFSEVSMEREMIEGGKTRFILAGSISNHSNGIRSIPTVRVSLRDKKGETMWGRSYLDPKAPALKAGEVYPFRIGNVETTFASSVTAIKVDMGNSLQLMVR